MELSKGMLFSMKENDVDLLLNMALQIQLLILGLEFTMITISIWGTSFMELQFLQRLILNGDKSTSHKFIHL